MNNRAAVERIRLMVDESKFAERLVAGIDRDPKGLKTNTEMVRLLLIGLLLGIEECKTGTITGAYVALTKRMDIRDQVRLGIKIGPGPKDFIKRDRLYYAADLVCKGLAYGKSVEFDLTVDERDRRHDVLLEACHALLDYTAEATEVDDTEIAIDATSIWGWAKGKYLPKPSLEEINDQTDELFRAALIELAGGQGAVDDLEGSVITDDPTKLGDLDPDSAWCGASAKNGGMKRFYGKYAHALVAVPRGKIKYDPNTRAPIVRRIEVTRATDDVVKVTLRLIDHLGLNVKTILVDRHYSYKKFVDWQRALMQRGIRQVFDLRSDDHKVLRHPDATYIDGFAHCPATPVEYFHMPRPGVFATKDEHKVFQKRMEKREVHSHFIINQMDADGNMKLRCPAREYKVACPLFPPSMAVAAKKGLTIINTDLLELEPGQEPPRCCIQDSFRITLPEEVAKLNQLDYWGSLAWYIIYGLRSYVEGVFGNMKNPRTENLQRSAIQKNGLVWAQLVVTLMSASYNVRMIRSRHDRMEFDPIHHPLLAPDEESVTHYSFSPEEEALAFAALVNQA
ncbi:MAG: tyrosine-protein phosphatase [Acidobacteria bacterium]|nr:tyrosine-protein phosphatase [Acidobacteriota bacterium]